MIDGDSVDTVVTFENGEDSTSILNGFTIKNGLAHGDYPQNCGGGIYVGNESSPSLSNLIICNNSAINGGGIALRTSEETDIVNTLIQNNNSSECVK